MEYAGLLAGLGNPGSQYEGTRHNFGFAAADAIIDNALRNGRRADMASTGKFKSELWHCGLPGGNARWIIAKPLTFMNLSGTAVQPILAWHKIPTGRLVVLHDELDLKLGTLRLKFGGGHAGHNGLKSIAEHLGTTDFFRLRLGIGRGPDDRIKGASVTGWVLGRPSAEEKNIYSEIAIKAAEAINIFAREGSEAAAKFCKAINLAPPAA